MANKSLQDIFDKTRYDYSIVKKSKTWFDQQANLLAGRGVTPNKILGNRASALTTTIKPGNLYMFFYDPKFKDSLPYYDRFPMVFPWKKTPDGFMGLNLHYLPYPLRIRLMDKLLQFKTNSKMDETTRLRFSWSLLDGAARFAPAKPCVKHYLKDHLKSPLIKIDSQDWPTAMMMPVERFVGASKQKVWQDSVKKI